MESVSRFAVKGALFTLAVVLFAISALAQQSQGYRAPRTKDGKPNLNGIWQAVNEANWNIEAHNSEFGTVPMLGAINAVPPGPGIVDGGVLPYKPEALAKRKENFANRGKGDPEAKCYRLGVPRSMYAPYPFQILQSTEHIIMVFQFANALRTIYMTDHKPSPAESWMGWSNGKWEGETLVIETTGFNGQQWLDRSGNYHSNRMKVVERITARSADTLNYEATIEDPEVFTRTWKISMPLYRRVEKDARVLEFKCIEYSEELIYGHLRKQPANR
jgi:hypothetical protein